jgi:hypothetical protein
MVENRAARYHVKGRCLRMGVDDAGCEDKGSMFLKTVSRAGAEKKPRLIVLSGFDLKLRAA